MGRKNQVKDFISIDAGDMSLASITGPQTVVNQFDILSYLVTWSSGQATNGTIGIEASLDGIAWYDLDFGATVSLNLAAGNHELIITELSFNYARPKYVQTNPAASGILKVELFATVKGA